MVVASINTNQLPLRLPIPGNQTTAFYAFYIGSYQWRLLAELRREYDGNACVKCGSEDRLHVHHLTYERLGQEDLFTDLVTLCYECHRKAHGRLPLAA